MSGVVFLKQDDENFMFCCQMMDNLDLGIGNAFHIFSWRVTPHPMLTKVACPEKDTCSGRESCGRS